MRRIRSVVPYGVALLVYLALWAACSLVFLAYEDQFVERGHLPAEWYSWESMNGVERLASATLTLIELPLGAPWWGSAPGDRPEWAYFLWVPNSLLCGALFTFLGRRRRRAPR